MRAADPAVLGVSACLILLGGACGGDDVSDTVPSSAATESTPESQVPSTSAVSEPEPVPTVAVPETTTAPTSVVTTLPASSVAPTTAPPDLDPSDIHELVVMWDRGDGSPLELAEDVVAFPVPVGMPEGSTRLDVSAELIGTGRDERGRRWEWSYSAVAGGPVGDVDITLDDNGPGAIELAETYDPILRELGWTRTGTTGSDPGDPGGPNSVNHVYEHESSDLGFFDDEATVVGGADRISIAGVDTIPYPMFVWLDEDLPFRDDGVETPGHRIDVSFELADDTVPVPLLATVIDAVPVGDATLERARVRSLDRPADSFDADEGLHYLTLDVTWNVPADSEPDPAGFAAALDGVVFQPGEESFFDAGVIEQVEPTVDETGWELPAILVDRYSGTFTLARDATGDGGSVLEYHVDLEPNRELLTRSAES